jgi:UDP-GlcNAc3NAcA epimerase
MDKFIHIVVIAGIRSQFMKLASLQMSIDAWNKTATTYKIQATYMNSGQHYDDELSKVFINELNVQFDHDLTGSYQNLDPVDMFGHMIIKIYNLLSRIKHSIDWVIVFGDANTTLAGALASKKAGIPLVHIEAGVRIYDRASPEENNRVLTDHLADAHFVSDKTDIENLHKEGITKSVVWTGDLIGDLTKFISPTLPNSLDVYDPGSYVLSTLHRKENLQSDEITINFFQTLNKYHKRIVFIAHPSTRLRLEELKIFSELDNFDFIEGLPYTQMISAIKGCDFIVTDSGALQREAYYLGKRCLIRQDKPFWKSLVTGNVHRAIGPTRLDINEGIEWVNKALEFNYPKIAAFGEGGAGKKIMENLVRISSTK